MITRDREQELTNLIVSRANEIIKAELNSLRTWLPDWSLGLVTQDELQDEFPRLISRIRAMIIPLQYTTTYTDPADGWQQLSPNLQQQGYYHGQTPQQH